MNDNLPDDLAPWFVRVTKNKVSVGIFTCTVEGLWNLVDEVCEPDLCEYKRLPPGGFIFGGEVVLHELEDETPSDHMDGCRHTDAWDVVYADEGGWEPVSVPW